MSYATLIKHNLRYFWRTNLAVIMGVTAAVAVLAGALLTGDSVRASLRQLLLGRLGNTAQVITATTFFRAQLAADMQQDERFSTAFNAACPLISLTGVITHEASHRRAGKVQVYGVDADFWQFHGVSAPQMKGADGAWLSDALARELSSQPGDSLVLRLEKPADIPTESLHGRKDEAGKTIRLTAGESLAATGIGEFSLHPQQGNVRAVFVPLQLLQKELGAKQKANTILLSARADAAAADTSLAEQILRDKFNLADLGLNIRTLATQQSLVLERNSNLLTDDLAKTVYAAATESGLQATGVFAYVANAIRAGERTIPYSLVVALEPGQLAGLSQPDNGQTTPIILNEWAARDLNARPDDEITLDYYRWQDAGGLVTKSAQFRLTQITALTGIAADRELIPAYPGITESDSISDWNPPFPVNLKLIRPQDEAYWKQYRTTPKAFIPLSSGQELWRSRFGSLTSIRLIPPSGSDLSQVSRTLQQKLKARLNPMQAGLSVFAARAAGEQAAQGATDFGEYFLYFSFFIVVSALLLTALFFRLGVEQRLREIGLLRAVGFPARGIRSLFLREGLVLAVIGSLTGLPGALIYGWLMMYGLRTWWSGAVGTTLLTLHVSAVSLVSGFLAGVITALLVIVLTVRKLARVAPRNLLAGRSGNELWSGQGGGWTCYRPYSIPLRKLLTVSRAAILLSLSGVALLAAAVLKLIGQTAGFFGAGCLLLIAALCWFAAWLRSDQRGPIVGTGWWPVSLLGFRSATTRPGRSVLCIALIASATFIIVAVDAFRKDNTAISYQKNSGTGGYTLLADSLLPIVPDPDTASGRADLALDATGNVNLDEVKIDRFRVREGDDASCLNLYQPRNPRIIAPTDSFLSAGRFAFQGSLAETSAEKLNPWLLLNKQFADGAVPVIADANSMTYVLHKSIGDELVISASNDDPVRLRLVGALSDSVLQGELVMSEPNFLHLFPDVQGWRFFLIDAPRPAELTGVLEDKLSDYGFDVASTGMRLAGFHRVENTYLSTFQTLGGLGLLLGTVGLAAVLLRNVLERRRELALLRATGFQRSHLTLLIVAENAFLLSCGLLAGILCALLAIAPAFAARGGQLSFTSLGMLLSAVLLTGLAASLLAVSAALRAPLLQNLRAE